ncbi:MAG TPA: alpha/beta fold hydrolase [Flavobacterium sp.]|jgi:hypothetical protein
MMKKYLFLGALLFCVALYSQKPQEPTDFSSYNSEDVSFKNLKDGVTLTGTFTYPKNARKIPVVILISGSGPQDRNSALLGHKPFLVIADDLTRKGIGVLRVDDRGTGTSEGKYNDTSLDGFVNDTRSAIEYIKTRKEVDKSEIGLLGHSLGGIIAPIIAAESKDVAFTVLLAGPGIRGDKLMLLQKASMERKMGLTEQVIESNGKLMAGAWDMILNSDADHIKLEAGLATYFTNTFGSALPQATVSSMSKQLSYPWLADMINFDPETALSKVNCPVLALNGINDTQVPSKENLEAIKAALQKAGNKDYTALELPHLNHLFQESVTGLVQEYATIEQTFSPKALNIISDWILLKTK